METMESSTAARRRPPRRTLGLAIAFELSLAPLATLAGWLVGVSPWANFCPRPLGPCVLRHGTWGLLAAAPLGCGLWALNRCRAKPLRRIRQIVDRRLLPLLEGASHLELAALSLAAGLGEEALFRGLIQQGVSGVNAAGSGILGWLVASLLFGLAHCVTWTYAGLAAVVGGYLGWLYDGTDSLLAPIVAHAAYDYVALVYLLSARAARRRTPKVKRPGLGEDQAALLSPDQLISSHRLENS